MGVGSETILELMDSGVFEAIDTVGEFLVEPQTNPIAQGAQDYARWFCRLAARSPTNIFGDDKGRLLGFDTACTPYLESIGEEMTPGVAEFEPAQCATFYQVTFTVDYVVASNGNIIETIDVTNGALQGPSCGPIEVVPIPGSIQLQQCDASTTPGYAVYVTRSSAFGRDFRNIRDLEYTRIDGQPDNCGDFNTGLPTPKPGLPPLGDPPPYNSIQGTLQPTITINNNNIEIDVGDGPAEYEPPTTSPPTPEVPPAGPAEQTAPDNNAPQQGEGDFGEPPPGFQWCGFSYTITDSLGRGDGVLSSTGSGKVWPRIIADLAVKYLDEGAGINYGTIVPITDMQGSVFIECPGIPVTGYVYLLDIGFGLTVVPIASKICDCNDSNPEIGLS